MIEAIFLLTGIIIFIGFFAMLFFERTKIPDILILMFLGLVLGSILNESQVSLFNSIAPYVGAIAFMMILFDGGLNLNLFKVIKELSDSTIFMLTSFTLSTVMVTALVHYVFGWEILHGLLLGAVVGGTSSAIVVSTVSKISVRDSTRILLTLESAVTDALCIVVSLAIIEIILFNQVSVRDSLNMVTGTFSIAIVIALVVAVIWIGILKNFHGKPFGYLLTVAVIFIMYSVVEYIKGNGAISVLVFGMIVGNARNLAKYMRLEDQLNVDTKIKAFQKEVAFFIRTFFFVYIGIIFNVKEFNAKLAATTILVWGIILLARLISVKIITLKNKTLKCDETILLTMLPRGLAAAVLASIPLSKGIGIESFSQIVFLMIILTNITATVGTLLYERKKCDVEENGEN
ncbi:MAG: cation:proton antiporter [Candidatus Altiarchaeota archaeon]